MTESLYWLLLLISYGILLFMGLHLIWGAVSQELKNSSFHNARRMVGAAFIVTPITGVIYLYIKQNVINVPYIATAINLTALYAVGILLNIAFLLLIDHNKHNRHLRSRVLVISYMIYLILVWWPIAFGKLEYLTISHIIANILLLITAISIISFLIVTYYRHKKSLDNFYSDDVSRYILWVGRSIYLFIGLAIIGCLAPFAVFQSLWVCLLYVVYQLGLYIYLYARIHQFEATTLTLWYIRETEDSEPLSSLDVKPIALNSATTQYLSKGIEQWITRKGFTLQGITLKSVALDICTNRTYLSSYINTTYNCSFKAWVTKLRIAEAKVLLSSSKQFTSVELAKLTGFSSSSSFINVYRKSEGITPSKWKDLHANRNSR